MKTDIFSYAQKDKEFRRISKTLQSGKGDINITGPVDPQKAYLIQAICEKEGKLPVIFVQDELRARNLQSDLAAFTDKEILIFRQRELNLTSVDAASREEEFSRISILNRLLFEDFGAVIVTAAAFLLPLLPSKNFSALCLKLSVGEKIQPKLLSEKLTLSGYERVQKVEGAGEFSVRGDILDIFPPGEDYPFRISFFDDEIDELKSFRTDTQRSEEPFKSIRITPARELFVSEEKQKKLSSTLRANGKKTAAEMISSGSNRDIVRHAEAVYMEDADRLETGSLSFGVDKWVSLLLPERVTLFDYLGSERLLLFLDEAISFRRRLDSFQADFMQRFSHLFEKGLAPSCAVDTIWTGADVFIAMQKVGNQIVSLSTLPSSGNGLPSAVNCTIVGASCNSFRGHEENLAQLLRQREKDKESTVFMTGDTSRTEKIRSFFLEKGVTADFSGTSIKSGFSYPAAGLMVIGGQDIFGVDRPLRKKKKAGIRIDLFSDLKKGELVVHEKHGIGRYDGMTTLETGGTKRDYLKITYASEDTLYISVEHLDQLQKYVSSEGRTAKLSRLGGQEWNRMKEKARNSIRTLAIDLVALYAKRQEQKGFSFSKDSVWQREFEDDFPFEETQDQLEAIDDVKKDMESDKIMDRLLCGDVGFGKTEVAFRALFKCVMDGKQAILLSPTTVLAQQHYENLGMRLIHFPVKIGLLSRFAKPAEIKRNIKGFSDGSVDIIIGTHRVLSGDVKPKDLGLLIIDEEQRFGVEHKEKIKEFRNNVDVLMLTATPIPRTLHMSMSGIRDISVLEEPPMDRRSVQTYVMEYDTDMVTEACLREISRQGQIFYLFNDTRKIQEKALELEKALPGARVLYAHGKMGERQLEEIIEAFILHEADVLVCTTIIESGIDMPNVNTIIVENAERFGLSQLYQIRGRVGRSDRQAYAYITYKKDKVLTEVAQKRLTAIRDFTELGSGMKIALKDLEVRGAGNLLGAEQHGQMDVIGYDLYCRMLEEEIKKLRGGEVLPEKVTQQAVVEMDVDAYIPPSYIASEAQRMDVYRRLVEIKAESEYFDVLDELQDRYGEIPQQVQLLADISHIRHMASESGFEKVQIRPGETIVYYPESVKIDMEALSQVLSHPVFKGRIMLSALRKPYLHYSLPSAEKGRITERTRELLQILDSKK